jgi:hypothetical protein
MLTSHSGQIFQHYIGGTGRVGSSSPASRNPYMTIILPLAHVDDLLFHCVLAVGGAHLSSRQPANTELHHATMHHYSYVLRSLRAAMLGLQHCNANQTLRVLLALVLTGSYEVSDKDTSMYLPSRKKVTWRLNGIDRVWQALAFVAPFSTTLKP